MTVFLLLYEFCKLLLLEFCEYTFKVDTGDEYIEIRVGTPLVNFEFP